MSEEAIFYGIPEDASENGQAFVDGFPVQALFQLFCLESINHSRGYAGYLHIPKKGNKVFV